MEEAAFGNFKRLSFPCFSVALCPDAFGRNAVTSHRFCVAMDAFNNQRCSDAQLLKLCGSVLTR